MRIEHAPGSSHAAVINPPDPFPDDDTRYLLATARRDFQQFYLTATAEDEGLMDGLVLAHAALVVGTNTLRPHVPGSDRAGLEKTTDKVEQAFTRLREQVRTCPTFAGLITAEQAQIERVIFEGRPSWSQ